VTANDAKARAMLANLRDYRAELEQLASVPRDAFLADARTIGAARYYLQIAIQCCIDLANHLASANRFRTPGSYRDAITVLAENGVVPQDFLPTLHEMVGLRQRLVHDYPHIDDQRIYHILGHDLGDLERFATCVTQALSSDG
jgi:uncharacterized protein YutE (UPF0331/DUF86 family)